MVVSTVNSHQHGPVLNHQSFVFILGGACMSGKVRKKCLQSCCFGFEVQMHFCSWCFLSIFIFKLLFIFLNILAYMAAVEKYSAMWNLTHKVFMSIIVHHHDVDIFTPQWSLVSLLHNPVDPDSKLGLIQSWQSSSRLHNRRDLMQHCTVGALYKQWHLY